MAIKSLKVNFLQSGADQVKYSIDQITGKLKDFGSKDAKATISINDKAGPKLADVTAKLDIIGKKIATARTDVNDSASKAKLFALSAQLERLNRMVANPNIKLAGIDSAMAKIYAMDASLDKLDHKNVKIKIDEDTNRKGNIFSNILSDLAKYLPSFMQAGEQAGNDVAEGAEQEISSNEFIKYGVIAAVVAASPFIAQALSGVLVFGLGSAMAAMAIYGASKSPAVVKVFDKLTSDANSDLIKIGQPFVPVLTSILSNATSMMNKLTPVFEGAEKIIAGPFKTFGNALIATFGSPAVKQSIDAVASAFGKLLTALSPTLQGDVNAVARGIMAITAAVAKNPNALPDMISALFKLAGVSLQVIAWLTNVATYIERAWVPMWDRTHAFFTGIWAIMVDTIKDSVSEFLDIFKVFGDLFTGNWVGLWNAIKNFGESIWDNIRVTFGVFLGLIEGPAIKAWNNIDQETRDIWGDIFGYFREIWGNIENVATDAVKSVENWISTGWNTVYSDTDRIWGDIANAFTGSWDTLKRIASNAVSSIRTTLSNMWGDIKTDADRAWGAIASGISTAFNAVKNAVESPINWVLKNVVDKGDSLINSVFHLGLPTNLSLAAGGKINVGTGPKSDDVLARVSRGETVVSAAHSQLLAPVFRSVGIPGYASGGIPGGGVLGDIGHGLEDAGKTVLHAALNNPLVNLIRSGTAAAVKAGLDGLLNGLPGTGLGHNMAETMGKSIVADLANLISGQQAKIANGPAGGSTGSEMANGKELYQYLLANLFGGHKIAAAGAIASIWGESTWNPFAQGTGGRGLIGWTPPGTISNADFSGGMRTQEPAIIRFVQTSGDEGVIREMMGATSILAAANLWGKGVERYGINDVHSTGLSLAASIMGAAPSKPIGGVSTSPVTGEQTFNGYSYANGGIIPEPVIGTGLRSGASYRFAENGPERVVPGVGGGDTIVVNFNGVVTNPDDVALEIQQLLRQRKRHHGNQPLGLA